ncbi:protein MTSS 2-like isoform X3 [Lineus longissimus]|uniref:protein MTSS 2-like isoform X3 n=1 Tax=Lineus longissimus TaxID=88925 RepID=UPI00315C5435
MESGGFDRDCSALGVLFQQIINDMKGGYPVWEDFAAKAAKLHTALRTTIVAVGAFLEVFQKVADMATNTRGATRDVGASLTRLCLRHKNIDHKLRTLNSAIAECLVNPVQERLEEWKKVGNQLDKDHMKDYKKARADLKKASSDTVKLQKKAKKGKPSIQSQLDNAMQEVNEKYRILENTEKDAVRQALVEERSRYCTFISYLRPVLKEEVGMLTEIGHLQEILGSLSQQCADPKSLPPASEQVILDLKGSDASLSFQTPPSSPSSLGSRKSSMCSISSLNSSSSGSTKSHSPSHHYRSRSTSHSHSQPEAQPPPGSVRLASVSSQDSGFTSQDTLFLRPPSPSMLNFKRQSSKNSVGDNTSEASSEASTPSSEPCPGGPASSASTWTNWPEPPNQKATSNHGPVERPHTISSAYEKNHSRPSLSSQTFEPPDPGLLDKSAKTPTNNDQEDRSLTAPSTPSQYARPIVTVRRGSIRDSLVQDRPPVGPKPKAKPVALPMVPTSIAYQDSAPIYVNMSELQSMANQRQLEQLGTDVQYHYPRKMSLPAQSVDLAKAIRELDAHTHALRSSDPSDVSPGRGLQMPNSQELADAIRDLEASTAALQSSYESRSSLQCSSGYGTMSNTPANSEDTIAGGDIDFEKLEIECRDKFSTVPRNSEMSKAYRSLMAGGRRPHSTAGIPCVHSGMATLRRGSLPLKPPPPVRRSSSMTGSTPVAPPMVPLKPGGAGSNTPTPQGTPTHKRSQSVSNDVQFNYAVLRREFADKTQSHSSNVERGPSNDAYGQSPNMGRFVAPPPVDNGTYDITPTADGGGMHSHASIIQSLAAKFAALNRTDSLEDLPLPPPPEELAALSHPPPPSNPPPVAESGPTNFLSQIKRGVQLKKVQSNDRSAPRVNHARV